MIKSKLFVLKQEIELLWTDMVYDRRIKSNGKPASEVQGGLLTVCFATRSDSDLILRWMTKDSGDGTLKDIDKMEKGKVCFYGDGFEYPPTKTYEFDDAFLINYVIVFNSEANNPMQTVITISPGIQNYGAEVIKPWNISYIPPSVDIPFQAQETEEKVEPKFLGFHFENKDGVEIGQDKIKIDDIIYLLIETENAEGDTITLDLDDDNLDYKYNGKVLENDVLKGISVTGAVTKIKLTAVAEEK